jgi:alkanesulfonate monooxygenase SsuD/methylene tetrahydromethanopterin reductase-like flavin-dependent oxidoreductase (luciferase family)
VTAYGALIHREVPLAEAGPMLEELGYDFAAVGEHVSFHVPVTHSLIDLAFLAGVTRTLRLVSAVTLAPLYSPGMLAKMTAELSLISNDRFELGIGVGGEHSPEFDACGVPVAERGARTSEMVPLVLRLLREHSVSHHGRYWTFDDVSINPRPASAPRIWVGGRTDAALRRAAEFGDIWLPYLSTPDAIRHGTQQLDTLCRTYGRGSVGTAAFLFVSLRSNKAKALACAASTLSRMYNTDMTRVAERYVVAGTADDCIQGLAAYHHVGAETLLLSVLADDGVAIARSWQQLAEDVTPALKAMGASNEG